MHLMFNNPVANQSATVRVRATDFLEVTSWDVVLYGIPLTKQGKEVTVNWQILAIDNNETFYTDSNGLEMQ